MARVSANLLRDVGQLLTRSHDLEATLENVVRLVARYMHASACSIYLLEDDGQTLVLRATRGLNPEAVGRMKIAVGQGIAGRSLAERKTLAVPDVRLEPRVLAFPHSGEQRFRSLVAVPLLVRSERVGVLTARTARVRHFAAEELELLEMIASQVGSIVLNARLLDRVAHEKSVARSARREPAHAARGAVLRGIGTSPGVARGAVHLMPPRLDLARLDYAPSKNVAAEWRRVQRAIRETVRQLNDVRESVGARFGDELAGVFTAHIMILEDQSFRERVQRGVDAHGNGARGLVDTIQSYAAIFGASGDPTLRDRAIDLEDVLRRVLGELIGLRLHSPPLRDGVVLVADTLAPSEFVLLETEKLAGLVTEHGGPTSHAAIFARTLEIPAVSGVAGLVASLRNDDELALDGISGSVVVNPTREQRSEWSAAAARFAKARSRLDELRELPSETLDGRPIRLSANVGGLGDLGLVRRYRAAGIGLFRTEILALAARGLPDEDEQFRVYSQAAEALAPEPVVIRCFDLGGDKAVPDEALVEANPQLGWRGIRLLLDRPPLLRAQLRAITRANTHGNLRVLLPMVNEVEELEATRVALDQVAAELGVRPPPLGVMIETPAAAAIAPHLARRAQFFSIGTNDLVQYTLATDRENERVAQRYDPFHPAVIASIATTVDAARAAGIGCSVCGELGGSPVFAPLLLGMGVDELSMAPFFVLVLRQVVRRVRVSDLVELAQSVRGAARGSEVRALLLRAYDGMGLLDDPDFGFLMRRQLAPRVDPAGPPR